MKDPCTELVVFSYLEARMWDPCEEVLDNTKRSKEQKLVNLVRLLRTQVVGALRL